MWSPEAIGEPGEDFPPFTLIRHVIFVIEFKVGESEFAPHARDQVWDYALDLKNFHETSHARIIAPLLIATRARDHQEGEKEVTDV